MANYSCDLFRYEAVGTAVRIAGGYRLRIEVRNPIGFDGGAFIWLRKPINPYTSEVKDVWIAVAGVVSLADLPYGAPDPQQGYPQFRQNFIEIDLDSAAQALELWGIVHQEVQTLMDTLHILDRLVLAETVHCGDPVEQSASHSISGSTSGSESESM